MDKIQIMKFSEIPLLYEFKFPKSIWNSMNNWITDNRYIKSDNHSIIVGNSVIYIDDDVLCEVYVFDAKLSEYDMCKHKINDLESELKTFITARDGLKKQLKEDFDYEVE